MKRLFGLFALTLGLSGCGLLGGDEAVAPPTIQTVAPAEQSLNDICLLYTSPSPRDS